MVLICTVYFILFHLFHCWIENDFACYSACPPIENICDAKHGWRMVTHNALCYGHAFKCQLGYCDKWCLEGPRTRGLWGLWHVKTAGQSVNADGCFITVAIWQSPHPTQETMGAATGKGQLSNIFTHIPALALLLHPSPVAIHEVHLQNWKQWQASDHLWPLKAGEQELTHRLSANHIFICGIKCSDSFSDEIQQMGHVETVLMWIDKQPPDTTRRTIIPVMYSCTKHASCTVLTFCVLSNRAVYSCSTQPN